MKEGRKPEYTSFRKCHMYTKARRFKPLARLEATQ